MSDRMIMEGVREYAEKYPVELGKAWNDSTRDVVIAFNEGNCNSVEIDLLDLIKWLKANRADLLAYNQGEDK